MTAAAALPTILRAASAAAIDRLFKQIVGLGLDFAPDHLVGPDVRRGVAYDVVGDWHLHSEGGSARRVATSYGAGSFRRHALASTHLDHVAWASRTIGHWSLLLDEVLLFLFEASAHGGGGYLTGNLRGPCAAQLPGQGGNGNTYGTDRGWAISLNGGSGPLGGGGIGFGNYSTTSVTSPNTDTASDGTANTIGIGYLPFFLGNDASGGKSYLRGSAAKWQIEEAAIVPGGNYASVDGYAAWGHTMYGAGPTWTNYGTASLALLAHFSGDAARNLHTHAATIAAALQASL